MGEADEDRLADQEMADVELDDLRERGDGARARIVEAVAGVAFEAELARCGGGCAKALEFALGAQRLALSQCVAPGARVQFDDRRARRDRGVERLRPRRDE